MEFSESLPINWIGVINLDKVCSDGFSSVPLCRFACHACGLSPSAWNFFHSILNVKSIVDHEYCLSMDSNVVFMINNVYEWFDADAFSLSSQVMEQHILRKSRINMVSYLLLVNHYSYSHTILTTNLTHISEHDKERGLCQNIYGMRLTQSCGIHVCGATTAVVTANTCRRSDMIPAP